MCEAGGSVGVDTRPVVMCIYTLTVVAFYDCARVNLLSLAARLTTVSLDTHLMGSSKVILHGLLIELLLNFLYL